MMGTKIRPSSRAPPNRWPNEAADVGRWADGGSCSLQPGAAPNPGVPQASGWPEGFSSNEGGGNGGWSDIARASHLSERRGGTPPAGGGGGWGSGFCFSGGV